MKPFLSLLSLTVLWSFFYAFSKWFYYGIFGSLDWHPTPELIASFLSLGAVFAYLLGGVIFSLTRRRYILVGVSVVGLISALSGYFLGSSEILFLIAVSLIGCSYGMWTISRNTLVALEIEQGGRSDTMVS